MYGDENFLKYDNGDGDFAGTLILTGSVHLVSISYHKLKKY